MPEKVTSLNGLKVTSEYCSYSVGALNAFYVKYQLITLSSARLEAALKCILNNPTIKVKTRNVAPQGLFSKSHLKLHFYSLKSRAVFLTL